MKPWQLLFGFHGEIGRLPFIASVIVAVVAFYLAIQASLAALPWMAEVLAPRGINAGLALNLIWLIAGLLLIWTTIALTTKRLRAVGRPLGLAPAAVLPLALLALLNDAIFLVSKTFVLPPALNWALLVGAAALTLWVLAQCLLEPKREK